MAEPSPHEPDAGEAPDAPEHPPRLRLTGLEPEPVREGGGPRILPIGRADGLMTHRGAVEGALPQPANAERSSGGPERAVDSATAAGDPSAAAAPVAGEAPAEAPVPWKAAASGVPKLPALEIAEPEPASAPPRDVHDAPAPLASHADTDSDLAPPFAAASAGPLLPPIAEPWWSGALDAVRTSARVRVGALVVVLALAAAGFMARHAHDGVALSSVRRHPGDWDGREAIVTGRVGDVFDVAGGWAFYLHQGRDTIVAYSRTHEPHAGDRITIRGQVQTGYLNGIARQALFELPAATK